MTPKKSYIVIVPKKLQAGFSLVELMVAITVGIVLMTGVVQMFLSSKVVFSTQQGISRVQEAGRLATEFMSMDIREAGYMGCMSRGGINFYSTLNDPTAFEADFETGIEAFASGSLPVGLKLDPKPVADSHVLVIRAANGEGVSVESDNNLNNLVAFNPVGQTGENCYSGICNNDILIVTDCSKARVFQTNNVQAQGGGTMKINHAKAGMVPGNSVVTWGGQTANDTFGAGSEIIKIRTLVYYVAVNPETERPSLYQKEGFDPAFELLEGIEDMRMEFGVDNNVDARVDEFIGWDAVDNWENVLAVRLELLAQSADDNVSPQPQTYDFAGKKVKATDLKIRQVFTSTVGIRSRMRSR